SFLALPRSPRAAAATEAGRLELASMAILAVGCVALGLAAAPVTSAIGGLVPLAAPPLAGALGLGAVASGRLIVPQLAAALVALGAAATIAPRILGSVRTRVSETWACGITLHALNEYTSTAFAKPIRLMFRGI